MARTALPGVRPTGRKLVDELDVKKAGLSKESIPRIEPETKVFKRRWLMLFIWFVSNVMQGFMGTFMLPAVVLLSEYYNVHEIWIEWTNVVSSLTTVIFTIPSAWLLRTHGLKAILLLSASATWLGSVLLLFSIKRQGFPMAFVGITIASVGSALTNSVSPRLANVWFAKSEVSTANCIGILASSVGCGLGYLIPSFLLVPHEEQTSLGHINWTQMIINAIVLVATVFWYEEKPPIVPSTAMQLQDENHQLKEDGNIVAETQKLLKNLGYMCAALACMLNQAVGATLSVMLNVTILAYFPGAEEDVGILGMIVNATAAPALVISGLILDKTKKFQQVIVSAMLLNAVSAVCFVVSLHYCSMMGIYFSLAAFGIFNNAISGVGVEMAVELTFPVSEGLSTGWLAIVIGVGTVILNQICGSYVNSISVIGCSSICVILLFVAAALAWIIPKNYHRQRANGEEYPKEISK